MSHQQEKRTFRRRAVVFGILIAIVTSAVIVEFYLHTYMRSLPVISVPEAYQLAPMSFEGTQVLSYSAYGCSMNWLMFYRIDNPTSAHGNYAFFVFFKTAQNHSLLTQTLDIVPVGVEQTSNDTASNVDASLDAVLTTANYTMARVRYDINQAGTYLVNLDLELMVYAKTVIGYLPIAQAKISIERVLHYSP